MAGVNIARLVREVKRKETIVTRPISEWLLKNGDDAHSPEVAAWIASQISTQPRVRSGSFSGAMAGDCLRAQELAYAGVSGETIDTQLRNIFNDGKWRHLRWQAMLLDAGVITDAEYPVFWHDYFSRGTIDGRGEVPASHPVERWRGLEFGFELKGVSTFQFGRYKKEGQPTGSHRAQIDRYFAIGGFDLFSYVIEDKTTQEFYEMVVERDDTAVELADREIKALGHAVMADRIHAPRPQCVKHRGEDWQGCPYGSASGACTKVLVPKPFKTLGKSDRG